MFCILARLLWMSTGLEPSLSSYVFWECKKIFLFCFLLYKSLAARCLSVNASSLFSLPCRLWMTLLTPKYSILYCNLILFVCVSVCSVCVTFSSSYPVFLCLMTYIEWRLHRMTAGVTHWGVSISLFLCACCSLLGFAGGAGTGQKGRCEKHTQHRTSSEHPHTIWSSHTHRER